MRNDWDMYVCVNDGACVGSMLKGEHWLGRVCVRKVAYEKG